MDNLKSNSELEQEIVNLRHKVRQEKLKKAEELLAHRLVYSAIIFVIIFIILGTAIDNESSIVQWIWLLCFFVIVLCVVGRISMHYSKEKEEAMKE
jgi:Ca2+/Na+ antiporter